MTIELASVAILSLTLMVLTLAQGAVIPTQQGLKWGLGSRDEPIEKTTLQRRIDRTVANHIEAMMIFAPLMMVAQWRGVHNDLTQLAAILVIIGRMAFIPLYLMGTFAWRTIAYFVAFCGIMLLATQIW